jgi:protein-disulfide isomerase
VSPQAVNTRLSHLGARAGARDPLSRPLGVPAFGRAGRGGGRLAMGRRVNYNLAITMRASSHVQQYFFPVFLAISAIALGGSSCDKRSAVNPEAGEVVAALDKAEGKSDPKPGQGKDPHAGHDHGKTEASAGAAAPKPAAGPPASADPIPGVDVSKLDKDKAKLFFTMASTLPSPCGKAHSLRTSIMEDTSCKRSSFAARYVVEMLADEASESEAKELYELHYKGAPERKTFKLDRTPYSGAPDAPVKVVEFFDYGCPTCKQFVPLLKEALAPFPDQAVLYYKQFPLPSHTHSKGAAQAALAAHEQGKFHQMHELLFARSPNHTKPELSQYAQSIGLDMGRFEANFNAMAPRVEADIADGNAAGVDGTPTVFINGVEYKGPTHPKYVSLWIEEELAVNR